MPEKKGEKFVSKTVSLPAQYWQELEKLQGDSLSLVEVTRTAVNRGIQSMLKDETVRMDVITKQLVQQKLKQRQGTMAELINQIKTLVNNLYVADDDEQNLEVIKDKLDSINGHLSD